MLRRPLEPALAQWLGCFLAMVAGIILGNFLAPKIPARYSRGFVLLIAFAGAISLLVEGIRALAVN